MTSLFRRTRVSLFSGMVLVLWLITSEVALADIKKSTGDLIFDLKDDGTADMKLTAEGFGIGKEPANNLDVSGNTIISGNLFVGTSTGTETLKLGGTLGYSVESVSSSVTLSGNTMILADSSSGDITLTLPSANTVMGRQYKVIKTSQENTVTVSGSDNIDGGLFAKLNSSTTELSNLEIVSNGTQWYVTSGSNITISSYEDYTDNLTAWWKIDETSGDLSDSTGNGHTLTTNNEDVGDWVTGQIDGALNFDSAGSEWASRGSDLGILDDFPYSFSCWTKVDGGDGNLMAVANTGQSAYYAMIEVDSNGKAVITFRNPTTKTGTSSSNIQDGNWHHVVGVFESATVKKLYVDGVEEAEITDSVNMPGVNTFGIGYVSTAAGKDYYDGIIDDARVYNVALTAEQVLDIYNYGANQ